MIAGCGIDTEELIRFGKYLEFFPSSPFVKMVLSENEIENYLTNNPANCFPLSFCCKEAFFKALGESWTTAPVDWKEIQLLFKGDPSQKNYKINLSGHAKKLYEEKGSPGIVSDYLATEAYVSFEIVLYDDK